MSSTKQSEAAPMGVDLTLMPVVSHDSWVSFDLLECERRRELWTLIASLGEMPVPKAVTCFRGNRGDGEIGYGEVLDSPYGDRLTWLSAGELASLCDADPVKDNWKNRSIWAWLKEAPADLPIVLYWH